MQYIWVEIESGCSTMSSSASSSLVLYPGLDQGYSGCTACTGCTKWGAGCTDCTRWCIRVHPLNAGCTKGVHPAMHGCTRWCIRHTPLVLPLNAGCTNGPCSRMHGCTDCTKCIGCANGPVHPHAPSGRRMHPDAPTWCIRQSGGCMGPFRSFIRLAFLIQYNCMYVADSKLTFTGFIINLHYVYLFWIGNNVKCYININVNDHICEYSGVHILETLLGMGDSRIGPPDAEYFTLGFQNLDSRFWSPAKFAMGFANPSNIDIGSVSA
jgi:hypothetical protein